MKKGTKIKAWTSGEEQVIIDAVAKYEGNRSKAFIAADKLLPDRTVRSISMRWYNYLGKKKKVSVIKVKSKGWMPRELELLLKAAKTHPNNITEGMENLAIQIHRSSIECMEKYIYIIQKGDNASKAVKSRPSSIKFIDLVADEVIQPIILQKGEEQTTYSLGDGSLMVVQH